VAGKVGVSPKFVTFKCVDITSFDSFKVTTTIMPSLESKMDAWAVERNCKAGYPSGETKIRQA
jgi:hypothetical protein